MAKTPTRLNTVLDISETQNRRFFSNPFLMKYRVKALKTLKAEKTEVGEGAPVLLRCASRPMIKLLREKYLEDKTCLEGDIEFLFAFDGVGEGENDKYYRP